MSKRPSDAMDNVETRPMEKKARTATPAAAKPPKTKKATKRNVEKVRSQKTGERPRLDTATAGSTSPALKRSNGEIEELQIQETKKMTKTDTESATASPETEKTVERNSKEPSPVQDTAKSKLNATTPAASPDCNENASTVTEAIQPTQRTLGNVGNPAESRKRSGTDLEKGGPAKKVKKTEVNGGKSTAPQSQKKASAALESAKTIGNKNEGNFPQEIRRTATPRATTLPSPSPSSSPVDKSTSLSTPSPQNAPRMANTPSPSGSEYVEDADDDEEPIASPSKGQNRIKRKIAPAAAAIGGDYESEDEDIRPSGKRARLAHTAAKAMLNRPRREAKAAARMISSSAGSNWADSSDGSIKKSKSLGAESRNLSSNISTYETDTSTSKVRQKAAGLRNHGRACFHNSVLQCLAHTKPIREHYATTEDTTLDSSTSSEAEDAMERRVSAAGRVGTRSSRATRRAVADVYKDVNPEEINLSAIFGRLLAKMLFEPGEPDATPHVSPMHFTQAYAAIYGRAYNGEASQDAHESLNQTLNRLKDEERASGHISTMVESVFQGIVFNHFDCKLCGHANNMTDDFMEFGVTMPRHPSTNAKRCGGPVTLRQCFDAFREREEFPDQKCGGCGATGGVSKVSTLGHVPSHLAVQICRWRQIVGRRGHVSLQKIDTKVNFPVQEDFDLSPWVSDAAAAGADDLRYRLYGVVQHHGSGLNEGHYIAYVKRDDGWWEMNDERTKRVRPDHVREANPYLLFYRKE